MKKKRTPSLTPDFGAELKRRREELGYSQEEFAGMLDLNLKTYARWERDENPERKPHVLSQEGARARLKLFTPKNKDK